MEKYELTDEKIQCGNHTLYRIKAIYERIVRYVEEVEEKEF